MIAHWLWIGVALASPCGDAAADGAAPAVLELAQLQTQEPSEPPTYGYRIVATLDHDPAAFTQGLLFHDGALFESTGLYGYSSVRRLDLKTGRATRIQSVDPHLFAEGLSLDGEGRLVQLSWRSGRVLTWNRESFASAAPERYVGTEGWGLTFDGTHLVQSDGSSTIYFRDPKSLKVVRTIDVRAQGVPVTQLNELEWVDGEIWSNVWMTDRIARISPKTGEVLGWIDLTGLRRGLKIPDGEQHRVLNGIAYDAATGRIWVGGKQWPKIYQIELTPPPPGG